MTGMSCDLDNFLGVRLLTARHVVGRRRKGEISSDCGD